MNVPTSSAVLLLHDPRGAFPIAATSGSISQQASHALSYDARTGEYEGKNGCEREPTERDRVLAESRVLGDAASNQLDYDAREGLWTAKGAGLMEDCSYWGQNATCSPAAGRA